MGRRLTPSVARLKVLHAVGVVLSQDRCHGQIDLLKRHHLQHNLYMYAETKYLKLAGPAHSYNFQCEFVMPTSHPTYIYMAALDGTDDQHLKSHTHLT